MCVHPELNQYIRDVLVGARALIKKGDMDKIVLAISNKVKRRSLIIICNLYLSSFRITSW